ncbi:MAG: hypothetical protein GEU91_19165 [Rhizobiales bacterium]|nr:hypothetical protein [Hyphomicrobiales bacterium]
MNRELSRSRLGTRVSTRLVGVIVFSAVLVGASALTLSEVSAQGRIRTGTVAPQMPSTPGFHTPAARLSAAAQEDMLRRLHRKRERFATEAHENQKAEPADEDRAPLGPETGVVDDNSETHGTLLIGRNAKNTRAEVSGNSTLAEPAAINNRGQVLYAGNFRHLEYSTNHGLSYADRTIPAGPADAPTVCCDNDMVIDDTTKIGFHSTLYVNGALTNGVVRIFVKRAANLGQTLCRYTIDPAGANNNILPDYPHIALSKNFLYLTINALPTSNTGFRRIYRFNLAQMRTCTRTAFTSFTHSSRFIGQRIWVPAEGANNQTRMLWTQHDDSDTIRIFDWQESAAAPVQVLRNVQASNFSNPDCRGGTGNFDFIERSTAWSIAGFRTRSTVARGNHQPTGLLAVYWHSAPIGGINQAHTRAAVFSLSGLGLLNQPHIFNQSFCFGYPAVTGNIFGDIGITLAWGGRAGGGGSAAHAGVGIDDDFTPGLGFFGSVRRTATGVANRSDGRFGDYFTIHPYQPCDRWFGATNYTWDSAPVDNANDVNARWVEFGREANLSCYQNAL